MMFKNERRMVALEEVVDLLVEQNQNMQVMIELLVKRANNIDEWGNQVAEMVNTYTKEMNEALEEVFDSIEDGINELHERIDENASLNAIGFEEMDNDIREIDERLRDVSDVLSEYSDEVFELECNFNDKIDSSAKATKNLSYAVRQDINDLHKKIDNNIIVLDERLGNVQCDVSDFENYLYGTVSDDINQIKETNVNLSYWIAKVENDMFDIQFEPDDEIDNIVNNIRALGRIVDNSNGRIGEDMDELSKRVESAIDLTLNVENKVNIFINQVENRLDKIDDALAPKSYDEVCCADEEDLPKHFKYVDSENRVIEATLKYEDKYEEAWINHHTGSPLTITSSKSDLLSYVRRGQMLEVY